MRTFLVFALAICLATSCDNKKKKTDESSTTNSGQTTTGGSDTSGTGTGNTGSSSTTGTGGGWSDDDKKKAQDECEKDLAGKDGVSAEDAAKMCTCMIDKAQGKFASYKEMESSGGDNKDSQQIMTDCAAELKQ
jgi:hypothetical protein